MICRFLPALLITVSILLTGAQASADNEQEVQDATAAALVSMDEFMLGFNARDPKAWAASLNYPHVRFASGTVTVWQSAAEFAKTKAFELLPESGWDHSHWLTREVTLASAGKVHIATTFQRFNADNEIIGTYQSLYIVTKIDGHWGTQARSSLAP